MQEVWNDLQNGIDATCAVCGADSKIYPGGLYCPNCTPEGMLEFLKTYSKTNGGYQKLPL